MDLFELMQNQTGIFLLIFARVTGIFTTAPVFGSRNVSIVIKAGLALLITYVLFPILFSNSIRIPDSLLAYILMVVGEFLVGLVLGFVSSLMFISIQMAGHLLDMQIGFGIINVLDPQSGQQVPLVGNFKYILALVIFLVTNGHHMLLSALFSSFKLVPLTGAVFHTEITEIMINVVSQTFIIAMKISLPVLASLLLTDIALGILARTMPQMNIFVVGIPGKIIVGLFVLFLSIPFYVLFLEVVFNGMFQNIYRLLAMLG